MAQSITLFVSRHCWKINFKLSRIIVFGVYPLLDKQEQITNKSMGKRAEGSGQ